jgi:nucleoid-associated protein YgaU
MAELKDTLKAFKLNESTISVILGAIVVLAIGYMAVKWFSGIRRGPGLVTQEAAQQTAGTTGSSAVIGGVEPGKSGTHTVAAGESLWKISQKYFNGSGYNWVDIAKENKLKNPGHLLVGQKLTIPSVLVREPKAAAVKPTVTKSITAESYTIAKGDSLWKISVAAYGDGFQWSRIYQANKAKIGVNPNRIFAEVTLDIPR